MQQPLGYGFLIERYALPARQLPVVAKLDPAIKGRNSRRLGNQTVLVFEPNYEPQATLTGHLQFALRYEGINLEVLALLFAKTGKRELDDWLTASPSSTYARRAAYLFEWLTDTKLTPRVPAKTRYVTLLDTGQQFGLKDGERDSRLRVINNMPGTREYCPLVRRTEYLAAMEERDLRRQVQSTVAQYDQSLLRRAAAFLYLKETQSSFEVERERPSRSRAKRFADMLAQADAGRPLTEERLTELQHAVVDPRFHEFTWRHEQNWVGKDLGYRKKVDFIPPRPEEVPGLMQGLLSIASRFRGTGRADGDVSGEMDPVVFAAVIAFGFVFIHPFMDGNGRIHRYLIHDVLANAGFTPRGLILPVSAVILANLDEYIEALEAFSRPMIARTEWDPDSPEVPARGNDALYFRYFEATVQTEFLYKSLERTIEQDLPREIEFLIAFDKARTALNEMLDWPGQTLDLFVRVVHQGGWRLSKSKRDKHFSWMTDAEVAEAEAMVAEAFERTTRSAGSGR
jgi:Fic family protein